MLPITDREIPLESRYVLLHWYCLGDTWTLVNAVDSDKVAMTHKFTLYQEKEAIAWAKKVIADLGGNEAVIGFSPEQMKEIRTCMCPPPSDAAKKRLAEYMEMVMPVCEWALKAGCMSVLEGPVPTCVKTEAARCALCNVLDCDLYTWHVDGNDLDLCVECYRKAARAAIGGE